MNLKLASFNVLNLNVKEPSAKGQKEMSDAEKRKEQKCKGIAEIISGTRENTSPIDIIALQEIQNEHAVRTIMKNLPSHYDYCHCGDIYDSLNALGFLNRHGRKFRSDYAFIWNTRQVSLCCDPEVYKKLHFQTQKCWDRFILTIVEFFLEIIRHSQGKARALGLLFPGFPDQGSLADQKDFIAGALRNTLRPPLIACFRPAGFWSGLFWELRMINTHVQWDVKSPERKDSLLRNWLGQNSNILNWLKENNKKRPNMEVALRQKEMEFIQGELYTAVTTCRNGDYRSIYTVVAGDFNMSVKETSAIYGPGFPSEYPHMRTIQNENSHWSQKEEKLTTSYDHFAFDSVRIPIDEDATSVIPNSAMRINNEDKSRISDHNAVTMNFKF